MLGPNSYLNEEDNFLNVIHDFEHLCNSHNRLWELLAEQQCDQEPLIKGLGDIYSQVAKELWIAYSGYMRSAPQAREHLDLEMRRTTSHF